jgi:hypothetical protein
MKFPRCLRLAIIASVGLFSRASSGADAPSSAAPVPAPTAERQPDTPPAAPAAPAPSETVRGSRTQRTVGWVSLALGAEAAVVASVTSFMLLHDKGVRDDECNAQKVCSRRGLDANGDIGLLASWNTASWIVAGAGLGAGAVLLLMTRSDSGLRASVAVAPASAGLGVGLHGAF